MSVTTNYIRNLLIILTLGLVLSCATKQNLKNVKNTQQEETNDWSKFNKNAFNAIEASEIQIETLEKEVLKTNKNKQQKLSVKLDTLYQKTKSLKVRLTEFNHKLKARIEEINEDQFVLKTVFEREFTKDMNELSKGIRDFWKTNKN